MIRFFSHNVMKEPVLRAMKKSVLLLLCLVLSFSRIQGCFFQYNWLSTFFSTIQIILVCQYFFKIYRTDNQFIFIRLVNTSSRERQYMILSEHKIFYTRCLQMQSFSLRSIPVHIYCKWIDLYFCSFIKQHSRLLVD